MGLSREYLVSNLMRDLYLRVETWDLLDGTKSPSSSGQGSLCLLSSSLLNPARHGSGSECVLTLELQGWNDLICGIG